MAGETLSPDEFTLRMVAAEGSAAEPFAGTGAVVLDISVDADQEREGLARDLVRAVQSARKEAGLDVSDRIALGIAGGPDIAAAMEAHGDFIKAETLALSLTSGDVPGSSVSDTDILGDTVRISVAKAG